MRKHSTRLPDGRVAVDIGHEDRVAIFSADDPIAGTEHDFSGSGDDWERRVFTHATLFRLHRYFENRRDELYAKTFPEAMTLAAQVKDDPERPNARILVYAVTKSGRYTVIPEDRWLIYLELWMTIKGAADGVQEHAPDKPEG